MRLRRSWLTGISRFSLNRLKVSANLGRWLSLFREKCHHHPSYNLEVPVKLDIRCLSTDQHAVFRNQKLQNPSNLFQRDSPVESCPESRGQIIRENGLFRKVFLALEIRQRWKWPDQCLRLSDARSDFTLLSGNFIPLKLWPLLERHWNIFSASEDVDIRDILCQFWDPVSAFSIGSDQSLRIPNVPPGSENLRKGFQTLSLRNQISRKISH
jgi:hypothetical protein